MSFGTIVALAVALAIWTYVIADTSKNEIKRRRIADFSLNFVGSVFLGCLAGILLRLGGEILGIAWLQNYTLAIGIVVGGLYYLISRKRWLDGERVLREQLAARKAAEIERIINPPKPYVRLPDMVLPEPGRE